MNGYPNHEKVQSQHSHKPERPQNETDFVSRSSRDESNYNQFNDPESAELYSRVRAQREEIVFLRQQIAVASVKEMKMLNEKYALEKHLSELRMAVDEKQTEVMSARLHDINRRKSLLEENLKLTHELKAAEDERYIFVTSILGLLGEYGIWPHIVNASSLSNNVKHLHDQLQSKIRSSHARIGEITGVSRNQARNNWLDEDIPGASSGPNFVNEHNPYISAAPQSPALNHYVHEEPNMLRNFREDDPSVLNNLSQNVGMLQLSDKQNLSMASPSTNRDHEDVISNYSMNRDGMRLRPDSPATHNSSFRFPIGQEGGGLYPEEYPGIDDFQIIGEAIPGGKIQGCGFPVHGTTVCIFQWVRHLQDGTRQYIEGATNPEYVVTADDVDKLIAVECIPMDDQGRQGDLVRLFANDQNKITCDLDMKMEIDTHLSNGQAIFSVLMLLESSDNWEPATLSLKRSGYQVNLNRNQELIIGEKFSNDLSIKIPGGLTSQFVLTTSNGSSHPFSTNNDVRIRDTLVLTMRMFQSKALDERKKSRA